MTQEDDMERVTLDVVPVKEMPVLDGTRRIRVDIDPWEGLRTHDGRRLSTEWGEPDAEGFYTPVITATDDGKVVVDRAVAEFGQAWERAERALPEGWRLRLSDETGYGTIALWQAVGFAPPPQKTLCMEYGPTPTAALLALAEQLEALR